MSGQGLLIGGAKQYGPYHRKRSPTQPEDIARSQVYDIRLLGHAARWSNTPSVKAYHGPLPPLEEGIEFTTVVAPSRSNHPALVFWDEGSPGVVTANVVTANVLGGQPLAEIPARVIRYIYVKP